MTLTRVYRLAYCKTCGASVNAVPETCRPGYFLIGLEYFMDCCDQPSYWSRPDAGDPDEDGLPVAILPEDTDLSPPEPEPEPLHRSRIELVLEDAFHG